MGKKSTLGIAFILLILGSIALGLDSQRAEAEPGTIYIRSDGSIDPSTAPIQREGNMYTLTQNISDSIVVQRNNVILDGAMHAIEGSNASESKGIDVSGRSEVIIKNVVISCFSYAVYIYSSNGCTIARSRTEKCAYGIYLYSSLYDAILENHFVYNGYGIGTYNSHGNVISGNVAYSNSGGLLLYSSANNTISSNGVTGNTGGIIILMGKNNTLSENNFSNNTGNGVGLGYCSNNTIVKNDITGNDLGISISDSNNNSVYGNNFIDNVDQFWNSKSSNIWDNGYPAGGNRWSDYTDVDEYNGPQQDIPGRDGIGDKPYVIDGSNQDHYPLMPWTPTRYYLTIQPTLGGTTNPPPGTHSYPRGSSVNVNAIPDPDYTFDFWLLDGEKTYCGSTITVTGNHTLKASFALVRQWIRNYDEEGNDVANSLLETPDGGYLLVGMTSHSGSSDAWLVKVDTLGHTQWNKTYGGSNADCFTSIINAADGGYVLAGYSSSSGGGMADLWLVKVDAAGNMEWNRTYGGTGTDVAYSIAEATGGGYVVAASTDSYGAGAQDFWLIKVDTSGNMQWDKTYGGELTDIPYSIVRSPDDGYVLAGSTFVPRYVTNDHDCWVVKVDSLGNAQWNKTYGWVHDDKAYSILATDDGGYVMAGYTESYITSRVWLVKIDSSGNHEWNQTYGYVDEDYTAYSVIKSSSGGYALAGYVESDASRVGECLLLRVDSSGNKLWERRYGSGNYFEFYHARSLIPTSDEEYALAGYVEFWLSSNQDLLIIKTDTTPPTVSIMSPENKTYIGSAIDLVFVIDEPIQQLEYVLDGRTTGCLHNLTLCNLHDGVHNVKVVSRDKAGNVGISEQVFFTISSHEHLSFPIIIDTAEYTVSLESNSTISDFAFNQAEKLLSFNVTGLGGTVGFCGVTIPNGLLGGPYIILINGSPSLPLNEISNGTHTFLNFTYSHSTKTVQIVGTTVVPEFPSNILPLLFMGLTAFAFVFSRRRMRKPARGFPLEGHIDYAQT